MGKEELIKAIRQADDCYVCVRTATSYFWTSVEKEVLLQDIQCQMKDTDTVEVSTADYPKEIWIG